MDQHEARRLLQGVRQGQVDVEEALLRLKTEPYDDLGYAKLDHHRGLRQGIAEVIYGAGKTPEQIAGISENLLAHGQKTILITRMGEEAAQLLAKRQPSFVYHSMGRVGIVGEMPKPDGIGEALGNEVVRLYDVGVAGLHRLLSHLEEIMSARAIIAIAGMEGALASVIGGLADCPVIGVPTSVGYGASFQGLSALLSMLNSCASGVSVVNIDNGFGAGYLASMINHMEGKA